MKVNKNKNRSHVTNQHIYAVLFWTHSRKLEPSIDVLREQKNINSQIKLIFILIIKKLIHLKHSFNILYIEISIMVCFKTKNVIKYVL